MYICLYIHIYECVCLLVQSIKFIHLHVGTYPQTTCNLYMNAAHRNSAPLIIDKPTKIPNEILTHKYVKNSRLFSLFFLFSLLLSAISCAYAYVFFARFLASNLYIYISKWTLDIIPVCIYCRKNIGTRTMPNYGPLALLQLQLLLLLLGFVLFCLHPREL